MPNHVTNILHIRGTPEQVQKVRDANKNDSNPLDFNKILEMPASMRDHEPTCAEVDEAQGKPISEIERLHLNPDSVERCRQNLEKHGFAYWYDWALHNWGTKWNAYRQRVIEPNILEFKTAWSCPIPLLQALASQFPDVELIIKYADEDIGRNCGTISFIKGIPHHTRLDGDRTFARKVLGLR